MSQVDTRQSTHGWPRLIAFSLAVGAAIFTWRGVIAVTNATIAGDFSEACVTGLACIVWIAGAAGIIHNGRRMRYLAWVAWSVNLVVPLVLLAVPPVVSAVSPWYAGGSTYFYIPTAASAVAIAMLAWSAPSRIAARNGA